MNDTYDSISFDAFIKTKYPDNTIRMWNGDTITRNGSISLYDEQIKTVYFKLNLKNVDIIIHVDFHKNDGSFILYSDNGDFYFRDGYLISRDGSLDDIHILSYFFPIEEDIKEPYVE